MSLKDTILAPGQLLQFIILEKNKETSKNDYKVSLNYISTNNNRKTYTEEYKLIIQYASQMGYSDNKKSNLSDEANAINNIANYLDAIRNKL